ncbi:hypothetical protein [Paraburkholderia humisilvae]|uniref:Uncharacterized protein n=2 Tax=Paraburkholderia humisilvae TaxID=627669 RepID=A0A6J5F199_9BURK|nr:hypothetical protein LMG29542_06800 [Paraburkholderia humisilvae]
MLAVAASPVHAEIDFFTTIPGATSTNSPSEAICVASGGAGQNYDVVTVTVWPANDASQTLWFSTNHTTYNAQFGIIRVKQENARQVPFATTLAPAAITVVNKQFLIAHQGEDHNIYYDTAACPTNDSQSVSFAGNWKQIPGAVQSGNAVPNLTVRPGLAASTNGQYIMVATSFSDNTIRYTQAFVNGTPNWTNVWKVAPGNGTTTSGIGVTNRIGNSADQVSFEVFHRGTNSELFYNSYNANTDQWGNNGNWTADGVLNTLASGPSVASFSGGTLGFSKPGFIVFGERADHTLLAETLGMDLSLIQRWTLVPIPSPTSHAPSVAVSNDGFYVGASYTADSHQIYRMLQTNNASVLIPLPQ